MAILNPNTYLKKNTHTPTKKPISYTSQINRSLIEHLKLQKEESNKVEYQFETCGEWNNDFVAEHGGGENEANQVLDDVNRNVVMI